MAIHHIEISKKIFLYLHTVNYNELFISSFIHANSVECFLLHLKLAMRLLNNVKRDDIEDKLEN